MANKKGVLPEGFVWMERHEGNYCINKFGDILNVLTSKILKGGVKEIKGKLERVVSIKKNNTSFYYLVSDLLAKNFPEHEICKRPIPEKIILPAIDCKKIVDIPKCNLGNKPGFINGNFWRCESYMRA